MKRKIAAIMAADIAGYSRLVAEDEEETLRRLSFYRAVFDDFIARGSGRVFNTAGDAILAEFASTVEAVRCAIDVQESLRTRNLAYASSRHMSFRIGITVGDVVERDGDLLGDGVNIAARLQTLAEPGGICVSRTVHEQVANKLSVQFFDIGEQALKNIPAPVHAYRLALGSDAAQPVVAPPRAPVTAKAKAPHWFWPAAITLASIAGLSAIVTLAYLALVRPVADAPKLPPAAQERGATVEGSKQATAPAPKRASAGCGSDTAVPVLDPASVPEPGPALRDALTEAIRVYFRCSSVPLDNLARAFATIAIVVPQYVTDPKCFGGETRVVMANWAEEKEWADRQNREDLIWVALNKIITSALACLNADEQRLFYADAARAFTVATVRNETHVFDKPMLKGRHVDRCLYYARDCNEPAAQAWCRRFGFTRATKWEWDYMSPTYTLGDRLVCPARGCGAFTTVACAL